MRNPDWTRDELILALDLYFQLEYSQISATNPKVIELSDILNKLPIHDSSSHEENFRNPNGVSMKLNNFKRFDPNYPGKGLPRGNVLEAVIWAEFANSHSNLRIIANNIKSIVEEAGQNRGLYSSKDILEIESDFSVKEGETIYRLHKSKERNSSLVKRKKDEVFRKHGKLECEACQMNFETKYGQLGKGFIECHHIIPLSELSDKTTTHLKDLALVCSNCHRMLHRKGGNITIDELRKIIANKIS